MIHSFSAGYCLTRFSDKSYKKTRRQALHPHNRRNLYKKTIRQASHPHNLRKSYKKSGQIFSISGGGGGQMGLRII